MKNQAADKRSAVFRHSYLVGSGIPALLSGRQRYSGTPIWTAAAGMCCRSHHVRQIYTRSRSAGANQRVAFRSPGREYPGASQVHAVNLPVVANICVYIQISLMTFARKPVSGTLGISPHGVQQCNVKGRGPDCINAVLNDTSVRHR